MILGVCRAGEARRVPAGRPRHTHERRATRGDRGASGTLNGAHGTADEPHNIARATWVLRHVLSRRFVTACPRADPPETKTPDSLGYSSRALRAACDTRYSPSVTRTCPSSSATRCMAALSQSNFVLVIGRGLLSALIAASSSSTNLSSRSLCHALSRSCTRAAKAAASAPAPAPVAAGPGPPLGAGTSSSHWHEAFICMLPSSK
mmetsp:Transcript_13754/g.36862  ORF Transcript_13754/g.36862 Transcript_13754/m.36862 type:complete len:205 (+) Transcript_13754:143-757(+)